MFFIVFIKYLWHSQFLVSDYHQSIFTHRWLAWQHLFSIFDFNSCFILIFSYWIKSHDFIYHQVETTLDKEWLCKVYSKIKSEIRPPTAFVWLKTTWWITFLIRNLKVQNINILCWDHNFNLNFKTHLWHWSIILFHLKNIFPCHIFVPAAFVTVSVSLPNFSLFPFTTQTSATSSFLISFQYLILLVTSWNYCIP